MLLEIGPPIYILQSTEPCWKCKKVAPVTGLVTQNLIEPEEEDDGFPREDDDPICFLINISELHPELLKVIRSVNPLFEKRFSKAMGQHYFMNCCPCGAHFGDFYLYNEAGGAFFPTSENELARMKRIEVFTAFRMQIEASYTVGGGELIYDKVPVTDKIPLGISSHKRLSEKNGSPN